jgi:modification methylase
MENQNHLLFNQSSESLLPVVDRSVPLIVTSPPYYNLKEYDHPGQIGKGETYEAYLERMKKVFQECYRVLDDDGKMIINIGDAYQQTRKYFRHQAYPCFADFAVMLREIGMTYYGTIMWVKFSSRDVPACSGTYPYPAAGFVLTGHEYIQIFKKPGKRTLELKPENKEASKLTRHEWVKYHTGVWQFPGVATAVRGDHPAPYPVEIPHRIIRMFSFVGDAVLDPFVGSGTTLVAASLNKRIGIGFELSPTYAAFAEDWFNKHKMEGDTLERR